MLIADLISASTGFGEILALRDDRRVISFRDLEEEIVRFDHITRGAFETKDFVLGACLTNRIEYPLAYLMAFYAGYPIVPIDQRLSPAAAENIIRDAGIGTLLVDSCTASKSLILGKLCRILNVDVLPAGKAAKRDHLTAEPDSIASINYTSGTTGRPKGVMLSQRNHLASCRNFIANVAELRETRQILHVLPFSRSTVSMLLPAISMGMTTAICECDDARAVMDAVERFQPDATIMYPALIYDILDHARSDPRGAGKLRSIKNVLYGSSPMSPRKMKEAGEIFGNIFIQVYGMTETLPPVAVLQKEDHARALKEPGLGLLASCGRAARGVEVRIADEAGNEAAENELGEIRVRGENVMEGYLGRKEETERFLKDGWACTGDLAYRQEGYIFIVDRKSDHIVRRGRSIYPNELENVILGIEGVKECAVFGIPHEKDGEAPCCAVVFEKGREDRSVEMRRLLEDLLPPEKMPVEFLRMHNLPRNVNGKIDRKALRDLFRQGPKGNVREAEAGKEGAQ